MNKNSKWLHLVAEVKWPSFFLNRICSLCSNQNFLVPCHSPHSTLVYIGLLEADSGSGAGLPDEAAEISINSILSAFLAVGKAVTPHVLYSKACYPRSVKRTFSYTRWTRYPGAVPSHSLLKESKNMDLVRNTKVSGTCRFYDVIGSHQWPAQVLLCM